MVLFLQVVENKRLQQLVDDYNRNYGSDLKVRGRSVLLLPTRMIDAFFQPAVSKCMHHVKDLLEVS